MSILAPLDVIPTIGQRPANGCGERIAQAIPSGHVAKEHKASAKSFVAPTHPPLLPAFAIGNTPAFRPGLFFRGVLHD